MPNVVTAPKVRAAEERHVVQRDHVRGAGRADRRDARQASAGGRRRPRRASAGSSTCSASWRRPRWPSSQGSARDRRPSPPSRRARSAAAPERVVATVSRVSGRASRQRRREAAQVASPGPPEPPGSRNSALSRTCAGPARRPMLRSAPPMGYFDWHEQPGYCRDVTRHFAPATQAARRRLRDGAWLADHFARLHGHRRLARGGRGGASSGARTCSSATSTSRCRSTTRASTASC